MSVWLLCERGYEQGGGVGLVQPRCPKGAHPLGHHFFACAHQIKRDPSFKGYLRVIPHNLLQLAPKTCEETND
jgi:hypothetical protein